MAIKVNADLFRLTYGAVSTEETRYYLNGVYIEPHHERGAVLVATDGHRMIGIHDAEAVCDETAIVRLPKYALGLCATKRGKGLGVDRTVLEVDCKEQRATIISERVGKDNAVVKSEPMMTAHKVIIEGTFPDWRKVMPKGEMEPCGVPGFNPKLLASLGQFGASLRMGPYKGAMYFMRAKGTDDDAPVVVRFGGIGHVFAILMPMRTDTELALPSFITLPEPAAIAA